MQGQQQPGRATGNDAQATAARAAELVRAVQRELSQGEARVVIPGQLPTTLPAGSPTELYEAMRQQRNELRNQLSRLEEQREEVAEQVREPMVSGADKQGLEQRLTTIDARIADVERQLAEADGAVARAAAIPGAVQPPPPRPPRQGPPEEVFVLAAIFMFVVLLPITIAYARRIWRRGATAVAAIPQEIYDRFNRLDQAIDSVAIEVERIGEGQRFLTRMYADQRAGVLGGGPAERVELPEREAHRRPLK